MLKGISILGVVYIHAGLPFREVFRFSVPVFVCLWAFHLELGLIRREKDGLACDYLRGRFRGLLLPYAFWTAIYLVAYKSLGDWRTTSNFTIINGWIGGSGWPGQYFLIILFQLLPLFPVLRKLALSKWGGVMIVGSSALAVIAEYCFSRYKLVDGFGVRPFVYWLPYTLLGVLMAHDRVRRRAWLLAPALIFMGIAPLEVEVASQGATLSPYFTVSVIMGSLFLILSSSLSPVDTQAGNQSPGANRLAMFVYLGRNTFGIFLIHNLLLAFARVWLYPISEAPSVGLKFAAFVFALLASILLTEMLNRSRWRGLIGG